MKFDKIITLDMGDQVICDFCDKDWTDNDTIGGFLFQSKAVCPDCSEAMEITIKGYHEEHFIVGRCPEFQSFADWVRGMR